MPERARGFPVALAAGAALAAVAAGVIVPLAVGTPAVLGWLARLEAPHGAGGLLAAALLQFVLALTGLLPASLGAIAAGALYGTAAGFVASAAGTMAAAVLAFLLGRSLLRARVARLLARHERARRLEESVARGGWSMVMLLRISPLMPFALTSYALGLTALRLRDYVLGSLAALPALFLYVLSGALAGMEVHEARGGGIGIIRTVLLVAAIAGTLGLALSLGRILAPAWRPQAEER
jgi:uncharacterized membrane protein YdjX (TVP38/TMEM64 family)